MEQLILTPEGERFMEEWGSSCPHVVAHTSGSTGTPKEIRLPKSDMIHSARATNRAFGINADSSLVCPLSASYIAGKMMIVRAIEAGCRLVMEKPSNHPLRDDYGEINLLPAVPAQIPGLLDSQYVHHVKNVIIGGAPISARQEQLICDTAPFRAFATYGMTETCSHVALRRLGTPEFTAMPGVSFNVDARGCLAILSDGGYSFNRLQTNDVVDLQDTHTFIWRGRADNVVISGGLKLFPEEIEETVSAAISLPPFFIAGRPSDRWGQELVMVIERPDSATNSNDFPKAIASKDIRKNPGTVFENLTSESLMAILRKILPSVKRPKEIIFVSHIPRTSSGKLIRRLS